jgi:hypothetical protein
VRNQAISAAQCWTQIILISSEEWQKAIEEAFPAIEHTWARQEDSGVIIPHEGYLRFFSRNTPEEVEDLVRDPGRLSLS